MGDTALCYWDPLSFEFNCVDWIMKKVLGIKTDAFESASVEEILEYFNDKEYIEFDLETSGFDCHTCEVLCFQMGDKERQYVIHPYYFSAFSNLLVQKTLIGQNIKFDLKFLYKQGIYPEKVYDTFLAECVLKCGIKSAKKNLAAIAMDRLGVDLDKSVRENIWIEGLTTRVIDYSADDVRYLTLIKEHQEKEIALKGLEKVVELENEFVLYLAYIEFCGFKLDKKKWKEKMRLDKARMDSAEEMLDRYIIEEDIKPFLEVQGNLFDSKPGTNINWSSSRQVVELFKHLGIPVEITEKGEKKESVEAKHIYKYAKDFPIINLYLEYKEAEKIVSTYGQSFLDQINIETGRIHTSFKQVMDTGRISSGGKNSATGEEYINFQNIPANSETRSCFVPEEGNVLIVGDYSGKRKK